MLDMIEFINKGNYLLVELSGKYSLNFFVESIHRVIDYSKKEQLTKVLVDARSVDGDPSIIDRYHIGLEISKHWAKNIQAAAVVKEEVFSEVTENVAVNRGANLKVFTKLEAAISWLEVSDKQ